MKEGIRLLKLFVPAGLMHRWLKRRHGIDVPVPGDTALQRTLVRIAPYAVSAILQQRKPTDRRVVKYFLPYGKMREHVKSMYDMNVGNPAKDRGVPGKVRSILPYGLILWWDAEDAHQAKNPAVSRPAAPRPAASKPAAVSVVSQADISTLRAQVESLRRENDFRADTNEIISLYAALGGARPSVTVVITGCETAFDVKRSLAEHVNNSIFEMELYVAYDFTKGDISDVVANLSTYDARIKPIDSRGRSLAEIRAEAIKEATGDYISFMNVNDRYATRSSLEKLVLTAAVEKARICGGKVWEKINGKVVWRDQISWERRGFVPSLNTPTLSGLAGMVFERRWLIRSGVRPMLASDSDDYLFVQLAEICAEKMFCIGAAFAILGRDAVSSQYNEDERQVDYLMALRTIVRDCGKNNRVAQAFVAKKLYGDREWKIRQTLWRDRTGSVGRILREIESALDYSAVATLEPTFARKSIEDCFVRPVVSFIIPVYNVGKLVPRCIASIQAMEEKAIEIICVNDGSDDDSLDVLKALAAADSRIIVFTQPNSGQGAARNVGIMHAKGKYIQFVDADDFLDSSMYPAVLTPFKKFEDIDFVQFNGRCSFDFTPTEAQKRWGEMIFKNNLSDGVHRVGVGAYVSTIVVNKLYRRDFIVDNQLRFPEGVKQEDEAFTFFVFARARKFYYLNKPWYNYVRTATGTMSTQESNAQEKKIPDCYRIFDLILRFLLEEGDLRLLGYFCKRVIGATTRFDGTPISESSYDLAAYLLRKASYGDLVDLMTYVDKAAWLRKRGHEFWCRDLAPDMVIKPLSDPLPTPRMRPSHTGRVRLTYLVLVDTFEAFVPLSIMSILDQEEQDVDLVCVGHRSLAECNSVIRRLSRDDDRIRYYQIPELQDKRLQIKYGLEYVKTDYVVIHEARNMVSRTHASACLALTGLDLDVVMIPDRYFNSQTRLPIDQYWQYDKQASKFPSSRVWKFSDTSKLAINQDTNHHCYKVSYLAEEIDTAPDWGIAPNALLLYLILHAKRIGVAKDAQCLIRTGDLSNEFPMTEEKFLQKFGDLITGCFDAVRSYMGTQNSVDSQCLALLYAVDKAVWLLGRKPGLCEAVRKGLSSLPQSLVAAFSMAYKAQYDSLISKCVNPPGAVQTFVSERNRAEFERIEGVRLTSKKDMYLVIGFLLDRYVECIDSWLFFTYLRDTGVQAKYVIPEYSIFYQRQVKNSKYKRDVIVLKDDNVVDLENALLPHLYRTKAVVMEDGYLPGRFSEYLRKLPNLLFVMLQHGPTFLWFSELLSNMFNRFNAVNTCGVGERAKISSYYGSTGELRHYTFLKAGMPRYDLLAGVCNNPEVETCSERIILIALSWRNDFRENNAFQASMYLARFKKLLCSPLWRELSERGVRTVVAFHHALRSALAQDVPIQTSLEVIDSSQLSEYIRKASCLVTDLSSIALDFLYQDKPVAFWIPDVDDYALSYLSRKKIESALSSIRAIGNLANSVEELEHQVRSMVQCGFRRSSNEIAAFNKLFDPAGDMRRKLYQEIEKNWVADPNDGVTAR